MRGSAGMSGSSGAGFQRTQRQQSPKQEMSANTAAKQQQQPPQPASASSAPAVASALASTASSAAVPSALFSPPSRGSVPASFLAAIPAPVVSPSVAPAAVAQQPPHQLPSSHALSRHVAACDDDLSPSAEDDDDATAADGYFITADEVAATQKLQAAHEARGAEIEELQSSLRDKQKQIERLQASMARLEKEQTDENASNFATTEQLRSDLSHEIQKHSATKVQLAQRGNDLASLVRERDLLSSSLRSHERELSSTQDVVRSLRDRTAVLEDIQQGMERDIKFNEQDCSSAADDGDSECKSLLDGEETSGAAPAASSLIPLLSSSNAPLHLRRSRLHSLLLHRTIADRKLLRLESELAQQKRENQSHLQSIAEQWSQLELIRHELHRLQEERDKAEEESKDEPSAQKDETRTSISAQQRFSSDASTSSLLLQLHQCREQLDRLEHHNSRFLRRFYTRVALWCLAIIAACWIAASSA